VYNSIYMKCSQEANDVVIERRLEASWAWDGNTNGEWKLMDDEISFWNSNNVLKLGYGEGCTLHKYKAINLLHYKQVNLVNCTL
jgi:hypothetical protein